MLSEYIVLKTGSFTIIGDGTDLEKARANATANARKSPGNAFAIYRVEPVLQVSLAKPEPPPVVEERLRRE